MNRLLLHTINRLIIYEISGLISKKEYLKQVFGFFVHEPFHHVIPLHIYLSADKWRSSKLPSKFCLL